ncbi:hypothetical protein [Hydrogenophaga sp.]|uniref:hypothetical protein n=1 Tax=Hydrogenophaga sp. TaxID=1904254 RepID=UPI00261BB385|nr:hypothetical protein [Hydrogenophaga sp.]MCW5654910.1 hypothetical protein [Hydrogenophaga sp.]
MRGRLVAMGLCSALSACAAPPTPDPAQLVFFHPFRPGVLGQCEHAHRQDTFARDARPDATDPGKAWVVRHAFSLRWPGGLIEQAAQPGAVGAVPSPPQTDVCFALWVDGRPVVSGAVVPEQSARLLGFATLVRLRGEPARYELRPRFPGHPGDPMPPEWQGLRGWR